MNSKHTPGPWHVRTMRPHFAVEASNGVRVADVRYIGRPDGTTSVADAALIAEAPAMLEALRDLAGIALDTIQKATEGQTSTIGYVELAQQRARSILERLDYGV